MRKMSKWLVSALIVTGVASGSLLWAQQGQNSGRGSGQGYRSEAPAADFRNSSAPQLNQLPSDLRTTMQAERDENRIETLVELSGRSATEVQQMVDTLPMGAVLIELGVSQEDLQSTLHAKMILDN